MSFEKYIDFKKLGDLSVSDIENIKDLIKKELFFLLSEADKLDDLLIKKSPLWFYQIELFQNKRGKAKFHYYPVGATDIFPHWHGWDIASIVLNGQIVQKKYSYNKIPDIDTRFVILEELIARSKANLINKQKIKNIFANFFSKNLSILSLDDRIKQIALSLFSPKEQKEFAVKYIIEPRRWITYPENMFFMKETNLEIFKQWDNYFLWKEEIHKVIVNPGTLTFFMIEKDPIHKNWEVYRAGPFKTLSQNKPDKVEFKSKIINSKEEKRYILQEIQNKLR